VLLNESEGYIKEAKFPRNMADELLGRESETGSSFFISYV
jgi:hypothetical protein